ncbi:Asp23/Gls24 family envelope stress response protein [Streptomyces sp. NPDC047123]|uniref:Asp23/Gls24 family envelope stress response protein n=1 Tax=Streptomyces sp. NPDC047123 TaxID=3155622 RepID=UPI0033DF1D18
MTDRLESAAPAAAVREAVLGTPGVAFLRPGLAELLRAANPLAGRQAPAATPSARTSAVRVTRDGGTDRWHVEVYVVLGRGHRALDVTRAVRAAVTGALRRTTGEERPPRVSVTVTGRM